MDTMNETRQWLICTAHDQYKKHLKSARCAIIHASVFRDDGDMEAARYFLDNARHYREMATEWKARYRKALAKQ